MSRPKMTPEAKAAAKLAREAAKADAPAAADRAEARSANAKPPKPDAPSVNSDDFDAEEKALFLNHHLPTVRRLRALLLTANSNLRGAYKKAKAESGFTKADFDTAFAVETAENEARERAAIARKLKIAKIMGSALGNQLDMFLEPDRTPITDRAYSEGEQASIENRPAKPSYDPSTAAFREYMEGFHDHQAKMTLNGIAPLATTDDQRAADAQSFDAPKPESGTGITRAQFAKMQQEKAGGGNFS